MRLKKRPRLDALDNEIRARKGSLGRWLYLGAITAFVLWLGDLFAGDLLYFKADGLVVRDRVVVATQFPASVESVQVSEGDQLTAGESIIRLRSQSVEENLAELSSDLAQLMTRSADMRVRASVIEAIEPVVDKNLLAAQSNRANAEASRTRAMFTVTDRARLFEQELASVQTKAQIAAERRAIASDLPTIEAAVKRADEALNRLSQTYADGKLLAPADGVVGYLHVSPGSVVDVGEPLLEVFHGKPYVLAAIPEGALYSLEAGDRVTVRLGFDRYAGRVARIYPVTAELPPEFEDRFNQTKRAPMARIEFDATLDAYPTLFARTEISGRGWPPDWLKRLFGFAEEATPQPHVAPESLRPNRMATVTAQRQAPAPVELSERKITVRPARPADAVSTLEAQCSADSTGVILYWLDEGALSEKLLAAGTANCTNRNLALAQSMPLATARQ
ncbi:MAG: HlyD family efflux transporter periplasmic adaptor subunit [Pseudomonadaceae bacterium]|nr:HlyD family efflux transporter periplasmic adaptor subunit [Pseudomonadaceae bacterium]